MCYEGFIYESKKNKMIFLVLYKEGIRICGFSVLNEAHTINFACAIYLLLIIYLLLFIDCPTKKKRRPLRTKVYGLLVP